jgi:hypothetical protein
MLILVEGFLCLNPKLFIIKQYQSRYGTSLILSVFICVYSIVLSCFIVCIQYEKKNCLIVLYVGFGFGYQNKERKTLRIRNKDALSREGLSCLPRIHCATASATADRPIQEWRE